MTMTDYPNTNAALENISTCQTVQKENEDYLCPYLFEKHFKQGSVKKITVKMFYVALISAC